jgi:hypothetical protein
MDSVGLGFGIESETMQHLVEKVTYILVTLRKSRMFTRRNDEYDRDDFMVNYTRLNSSGLEGSEEGLYPFAIASEIIRDHE